MVRRPLFDLFYQTVHMIDDIGRGAVGGMKIGRRN
jgi:hypothetical protein